MPSESITMINGKIVATEDTTSLDDNNRSPGQDLNDNSRATRGQQKELAEVGGDFKHGGDAQRHIKSSILAPTTISSYIRSLLAAAASKLLSNHRTSPRPNLHNNPSNNNITPTPIIVGTASALREVLFKHGIVKPPVALLKALVINGAFTLHHTQSDDVGSVEDRTLENSIIIPNQGVDNANFMLGELSKECEDERTIQVVIPTLPTTPTNITETNSNLPRPSPTLRATLVYPSSVQNEMNLIITASDGTQYHGTTGKSSSLDEINNVKQVVWKGIPAGEARIQVCGKRDSRRENILGYALVWRVV